MIKLQKVYKTYNYGKEILTILSEIDLEIKKGELLSIIGPSGSGKSTLMYIIGLLEKPDSGQILFSNDDISAFSDDQISRLRNRQIGFVFQQFNLINKLSVLENIMLPAIYSKKSEDQKKIRQRAYDLAVRFGIEKRVDMQPNKISGGEQQRVAIARALIMKPELILADEPTGNLDSKSGQNIINLLLELNQKDKITVVIVTHDMDIAKKTKRTIKIIDGKIV